MVKNLSAKWETWVRSLGWEDLLEEGKATHSQYSCLENPMDRGVWQATVHGIAKSWTTLNDEAQHSIVPAQLLDVDVFVKNFDSFL